MGRISTTSTTNRDMTPTVQRVPVALHNGTEPHVLLQGWSAHSVLSVPHTDSIPAHAESNAVHCQQRAIQATGILSASVAVMDEACEIQPALLCPNSRNVRYPFLVGLLRLKIMAEHIRSDWLVVLTIGRVNPTWFPANAESRLAHQARYPFPPAVHAALLKDRMDTGTPIHAPSLRENVPTELGIGVLPHARLLLAPGAVATLGHEQHTTHHPYGELLLRMSRSCRRISFSRRKRRSSSSNSV